MKGLAVRRVARIVDLNNIGVLQPGHSLRLAPETLDKGNVLDERRQHNLEHDVALQANILGQVDVGHPPTSQVARDGVVLDRDAAQVIRNCHVLFSHRGP